MPYNNLLKDAAASIKPFINMNSTFSKMAPYIKLLLDILTRNRIFFLTWLETQPSHDIRSEAVSV